MTARAISATFSDWRTVKGRKMLQLVFEVGLEQQQEVLTMLGAPLPDSPRWCAIALLNNPAPSASPSPKDSPKADGAGERKSERAKEAFKRAAPWVKDAMTAGMLCGDDQFIRWMLKYPGLPRTEGRVNVSEWVVHAVRHLIGATSRAEIGTDPEVNRRWRELYAQYLKDTGQMAEERA